MTTALLVLLLATRWQHFLLDHYVLVQLGPAHVVYFRCTFVLHGRSVLI